MAADSILGGGVQNLSAQIKGVLDSVLDDTQGGTIVTTTIGSSTVVQGLGANNETQGALVPSSTGPTIGTLSNGSFVADVDLGTGVGLSFEGLNTVAGGSEVSTYLKGLIDAALPGGKPSPAVAKLNTSLTKAVNSLVKATDTNTVVRVLNVLDNSTDSTGEIKISGSATKTTNDVVALNLNASTSGKTVVLNNLDKVVIVGSGNVRLGDTAAAVSGDNRSQVITGGAGADTITGGGGFDTLTGGLGDNTFGLSGSGGVTITDFKLTDKLNINLDGINDIATLKAAIYDVKVIDGQTRISLESGGEDLTVTLVGTSPSIITADMITFG